MISINVFAAMGGNQNKTSKNITAAIK